MTLLYQKIKSRSSFILLIEEQHPGILAEFDPAFCEKRGATVEIGDDSPSATNTQRIAKFILNIPSEDCLKQCKTHRQLQEWLNYRDESVLIARCFLAVSEDAENPLEKDLEKGLVSSLDYQRKWIEGLLFQNLWRLIHFNYQAIEKVFKSNYDYPLSGSMELYKEIIRESLEGEFLKCFKPYYEYKTSELKRMSVLKRRKRNQGKLPQKEDEELWRLIDKHCVCIWNERLAAVCNALINSKQATPLLEALWKNQANFVDALDRINIQRDCNKHERTRSHIWMGGEVKLNKS